MSRKLTFSAEARRELREAASWYEARSPGLGQELLTDARDCLRRIDTQPETGSPVKGVPEAVGARRVLLKRFPYAVIYIELEAEARVLAFAHVRRRPGYWKSR
jgi:plasmid stabilization system protein ParE